MSLKEAYAVIGRMLAQLADGKPVDPENVVLPVIPYPS